MTNLSMPLPGTTTTVSSRPERTRISYLASFTTPMYAVFSQSNPQEACQSHKDQQAIRGSLEESLA
jgi:hypothetical protein